MHVFARHLFSVALVFGGLAAAQGTARAAEDYDNCTGFIDSLPATVGTQGVWCLRHDLSGNLTSGGAITVTANNVTIDCNDFKLGGLGAGNNSLATGILAQDRQNATVRRCNVRGFLYGIYLQGGAGHLVEDNRLDNNLYVGIWATGDNSVVRRNRVFDTGGSTSSGYDDTSYAVVAVADVLDNTLAGVFAVAGDADATGINLSGNGSQARGNRIRGLDPSGAGAAYGIDVYGEGNTIDRNRIASAAPVSGWGIYGNGDTNTFCSRNTVAKFSDPLIDCQDAGGNASN